MLPRGIVSLASDGTVVSVEQCAEPDRMAGVEFYSGILVPGFVNAHCHLELSHMRGAIPPGGGYAGFAKGMSEKRTGFSDGERLSAAEAQDAVLWQKGVAAVGDVCNGTTTFAVKSRSPVRYHNFLELFGFGSELGSALGDAAREAVRSGLVYSATPHSTYSLNETAFRQAVRGFSQEPPGKQPPLSVHFMESPAEEELFRGQGDMWEWYAQRGLEPDFTGRYVSPADRITALVPPDRDIMLIHNCCATCDDIDRILAHFTGRVTWVLCPRSNGYISRLEPPAGLLRKKGARIAVGTDSLASNHSLDMIEELKLFTGIPLEELLGWATVNGAEALGMEDGLGGFEPGMRPGVVLVSGIDWDTVSLTPAAASRRIF